ncbi:MAG: hypothetical protein WC787_04815 [Patescibacteria group bacterium]|jgi:hypothetical protein
MSLNTELLGLKLQPDTKVSLAIDPSEADGGTARVGIRFLTPCGPETKQENILWFNETFPLSVLIEGVSPTGLHIFLKIGEMTFANSNIRLTDLTDHLVIKERPRLPVRKNLGGKKRKQKWVALVQARHLISN